MFHVGLIGCGGISTVHAPVLGELDNTELVACSDIIPGRAERYGCTAYADWQDMLEKEKLDAVHICTPHYLHPVMVSEAARRGIAVFTEKPPAINNAGWETVKQAAKSVPVGICFQNRYHPHIRACKRFLQEGTYGELKGIRAFMTWSRSAEYYTAADWKGKWATEGGGALINQAIHTLDLMKWLSGGFELKSATMTAKRLAEVIETEDTCDMLLENERGGRFLLYCTVCAVGNMPVQLHLKLEKGEIHMDGSRLTIVGPEETVFEDYAAKMTVGKDYWGASHEHLIREFYRAILAGEAPYVTPADALETTRIMEQAYLSASQIRKRPAK